LRKPLSMIKGYVETLIHGAKDDPKVATRFLQTIEKHADRLTYLIEDLLTISRLESGRIVMNMQRVELRPVVDDVLNDLKSRAGDKDVVLENQVPEEIVVRADADRIQQVLFNLVDNAIKYGRPDGRVWIQARLAVEQLIEVSVCDNGPGIPPEAIDRVFERFYRVDKARSREQRGTGLGLSIVKHIVQYHGGAVWAESELERGTTFSFTLPPARRLRRGPMPVRGAAQATRSRKARRPTDPQSSPASSPTFASPAMMSPAIVVSRVGPVTFTSPIFCPL